MAEGFLGRWSRRKLDVKEGKPLAPEPPRPAPAAPPAVAAPPPAALAEPAPAPAAPPPPTLDDVRALTRESDFSAFARPGVDPEVRNAAMKKLFTDPHYNVMDGLDIYIDDYSKPDPIPPAMLRQLASAKFLNLFGDEEKEAAEKATAEKAPAAAPAPPAEATAATTDPTPGPREVADNPTHQTVAQSGAPGIAEVPADRIAPDHADPDLRLQQDDAPAGEAARDRAA